MPDRNLIFDIGVSDGTDTAFYLSKGFRVVGVEADPLAYASLRARFDPEIASGRMKLLHRAAAGTDGEIVSFWHDMSQQSHSSLRPGDDGKAEFKVPTVNWPALVSAAGAVPRMCKMDIEGAEPDFIRSMIGAPELPTYISSEMPTFRSAELFHELGYQRFRLVNQTIWHGITLPDPSLEGVLAPKPAALHAWSGPFGRELPGATWFSFEDVREQYSILNRMWQLQTVLSGWLDCHAWNGED